MLRLTDGRPINDAIVNRRAHWTESFRAIDWNADGLFRLTKVGGVEVIKLANEEAGYPQKFLYLFSGG